ncbi:MAG: M56 family metallopeptidase [Sphingobacteriales bacterium]
MIPYLVNSTLSSALLLAFYHILLKNKTMYNFNRFYLVAGLVFSFVVPFIVIEHYTAPLPSLLPAYQQTFYQGGEIAGAPVNQHLIAPAQIDYRYYAFLFIYGAVTFLLLFRLIRNLVTIYLTVIRNERVRYNGAQLVLIAADLTPHTFLNYIFLNKKAYSAKKIENEVLHHELTHARQCHSADIIFIELVQAVCWFNPFLVLYRRAIQINHEFIADDAVVNKSNNVSAYQHLLLSKSAQLQSLTITSRFNYSITKKRLIMMTKTTSATTAWFTRLALIPVMAAAFMLFCNKTDAQQTIDNKQTKTAIQDVAIPQKAAKSKTKFASEYPSTKEGISADLMAEYTTYEKKYATRRMDMSKTITQPVQKRMEELYQQMSKTQQKNRSIFFMYPPRDAKPLPESSVSRRELDSWNDPAVYGVWIDGKRVKNSTLKDRQPKEFKQMFFSRLTPLAVKNDKFHYQVDLMTTDYYKKYRKEAIEEIIANRHKSMIYFRVKLRTGLI